jgi:hypothetical protein
MEDDVIWIVTDRLESTNRPKGEKGTPLGLPILETGSQTRFKVKSEKLKQGVTEFLQVMGGVIREAKHNAGDLGGMELDEIELMVEVNGEGQLSLLGNGGKAGGKGAMTLKFKMMRSTPLVVQKTFPSLFRADVL